MRIIAIVAGLMGLVLALDPTLALAGGNVGGTQNSMANSYHCKSGKVVRNAKACKENGGHF